VSPIPSVTCANRVNVNRMIMLRVDQFETRPALFSGFLTWHGSRGSGMLVT
jgi:hypothetical protein